jgi:DNA-binding beta-propeller fold protein YncE
MVRFWRVLGLFLLAVPLSVVLLGAAAPIGSFATGIQPNGVAVDSTSHRVFVAESGAGTLGVYDGTAGTRLAWVDVGHSPMGVAFSASLNRTFVSNTSDCSVLGNPAFNRVRLQSWREVEMCE